MYTHAHLHTHTHTHTHSYYPLVPPDRRDQTHAQAASTASENASDVPRPPSEACEVNLDYIQAFEEQHATLPARPDVLLLPSDLKPFVKVHYETLFPMLFIVCGSDIHDCVCW